MADAIDLEPRDYPGTYKLIGGAPSLDFANLVSYRGTDREHDWLLPAANAGRWAAAAGLDVATGGAIGRLRELREVLAQVFLAIADGQTPAPGDLDAIGSLAAAAWRKRRLVLPPGAPAAVWLDPSPTLRTAIAVDAASVLTSADAVRRIAACGECRWVFLDTSRNRSRRWCDPGDCGNRARQRRHYRRHRPDVERGAP